MILLKIFSSFLVSICLIFIDFLLKSKKVLIKAHYIFLILFIFTNLQAANIGDVISNTANATFEINSFSKTTNSNKVDLIVEGTKGEVQFFSVNSSSNTSQLLGHSSYLDTNNNFILLPAPVTQDGTIIDTTIPVNMKEATIYNITDLLLVQVKDLDRNIDTAKRDELEVTIISPSGDRETIILIETGIDTAIFTGYIQSTKNASNPKDGILHVKAGENIEVDYIDQKDTLKSNAIISPNSYVFIAENGNILEKMIVSLIDSSGNIINSMITDITGKYNFGDVKKGTYKILVTDPNNKYYFPSSYSPSELSSYGFTVINKLSYGETFSHNGGILGVIDIPTDKDRPLIWIEKSVNKSTASIGDIVKYTIIVHNDGSGRATDLKVDDHLPQGIKFLKDTVKVNNIKSKAEISKEGKDIFFNIPILEGNSEISISFIAEITAGIVNGEAINQVWVEGQNIKTSNIATAKIKIIEELMRSEGIIVGQVFDCRYKKDRTWHGVENVRIYMEDGRYILTDKNGKYHFEGVTAGTHVVQIDEAVLPNGYEVGELSKNARFAGRNFSQFVNMGRGALKRADFCLNNIGVEAPTEEEQKEQREERKFKYEMAKKTKTMPKYSPSEAEGKNEILWPPEKHVPSISSTGISIAHDKDLLAEVWLNDKKVDKLNFNGSKKTTVSNTAITSYKGVDLLNRTNTITVKLLDKNKKVIKILKRKIHVTGRPVRIIYLEDKSRIIADGMKSPIIAVKFIDSNGYPVREGIVGDFTIDSPYKSEYDRDSLRVDRLGDRTGENKFTIAKNGIAYIRIQPTTKSGTASLHFKIQERDEVIRAWLKPKARDWIMVGFAEGTIGYNTLNGNKEGLSAKGAEKTVKQGRVSFFAKGRIKGDWLLTLAYDTGKDTKNSTFFDEIDPNKYYTLYNDNSAQQAEAATKKKLFVKVENGRFSTLFGDFNTNFSETELADYSRTFTGLKSEYNGNKIKGSAFIANTDQLFMRDEIRGDGTSGYYQLKNEEIIDNSEKIIIEVRDRYRPEIIIEKKSLQRYKDYTIDYNKGTLYFKSPIYSNDDNFNPQYIVAEYEVEGDGTKHYTYGARVSAEITKNIQAGATYINEDTGKKQSELYGADTKIRLGNTTIFKAEYAKSKTTEDGNTTYGDAKKAEIEYVSEGYYGRIYYREQDDSFGLGQLSESLGGTRKLGFEGKKTFDNRVSINLLGYRSSNLTTKEDTDVFQIDTRISKTDWFAFAGYRFANNTNEDSINQILVGGGYNLLDSRLKLIVKHDQSFGDNQNKEFPTKTTIGADYAIAPKASIFGTYEWAQGDHSYEMGRMGFRFNPWEGMIMERATVTESKNDLNRVYDTMGLAQTYTINDNWSLVAGYEMGDLTDGVSLFDVNDTSKDPFEAYRLGVNYHTKEWSGMVNFEYRDGTKNNKFNYTGSIYTQVNDNLAVAFSSGYSINNDLENHTETKDADARFSLAYRPQNTKWIILEKLDYIYSVKDGNITNDNETSNKIINNLNLNYMPNDDTEISFQHGFKYVIENIEDYEHTGITQLAGIDARYDITEKVEVGVQGSILYAQSADNWDYGYGAYVGYNIMTNMVISVGYNLEGFEDRDFSLQTYRTNGPYFRFKMKVDQHSMKDAVKMMTW